MNFSVVGILAQDKFNIASVIQCCRTSQNPQTHHQALLLLGKAAKLFPVGNIPLQISDLKLGGSCSLEVAHHRGGIGVLPFVEF